MHRNSRGARCLPHRWDIEASSSARSRRGPVRRASLQLWNPASNATCHSRGLLAIGSPGGFVRCDQRGTQELRWGSPCVVVTLRGERWLWALNQRHGSISNAIGRRRIYNLRELRGDFYADTRSYGLICPADNAVIYEIFIPRALRLFAIHTSTLLVCNVFSWSRRY
jgi:hypothetical protein